jgi:hypothetical protein
MSEPTFRVTAKDANGVTSSTGNLTRAKAEARADELRAARIGNSGLARWTVTVEAEEAKP